MEGQIDYRAIFKSYPGAAAVLDHDFVVLDMSDDAAEIVGRPASDIVGQYIFDIFPENPEFRERGRRDLRASLEEVLASGEQDVMPLTRYDFEDPGRPGVLEERYWAIVNTPVIADGHVSMIIIRAQEVTHLVHHIRMINS
jgi:PAS domain S-box-containing protein